MIKYVTSPTSTSTSLHANKVAPNNKNADLSSDCFLSPPTDFPR